MLKIVLFFLPSKNLILFKKFKGGFYYEKKDAPIDSLVESSLNFDKLDNSRLDRALIYKLMGHNFYKQILVVFLPRVLACEKRQLPSSSANHKAHQSGVLFIVLFDL